MHEEPAAQRAASTYEGGAGLQKRHANDPFPRWAGVASGLAALILTVGIAGTLYAANPAFQSGKAFGTADQIGQIGGPSSGGGAEPTNLSPEATEGRKLIGSKGCGGCHVVPGIASAKGSVGPSLAGVAGKTKIAGGAVPNTGPDDMKHWIMNPPALKPGTGMPNLGLTEDEATKIVAYLELLK